MNRIRQIDPIEALFALLIIALLSFVAFVAADFTQGESAIGTARVREKQYSPAWVETTSHTDAKGNTSFSTDYHPESYRILLFVEDDEKLDWKEVYSGTYNALSIGEKVGEHYRIGHYSGHPYVTTINLR